MVDIFTTNTGDEIDVNSEPRSIRAGMGGLDISTDSEFYSEDENAKPKGTKRLSRAKAKKARRRETAEMHTKGPTKPMKDIEKTMDRIIWDERLDETEWLVGYEDRHSARMLEKPLLEWKAEGGKLKDVTEEEFIPLHRVRYLRRTHGEERYWDRGTKTDRIEELAREAERWEDPCRDTGKAGEE